jgi:hypothetical protein
MNIVPTMFDNLKHQIETERGPKDALNKIRDPSMYAAGSASHQLIKRMVTTSLSDTDEEAQLFQLRPSNDVEAIVPLVKIIIHLCTRYNSAEAQERLERSIGETLIKYPEGADIFKVFNEIENLVVLLGEEPEETKKKVVKKVRESLKFNINRNVGNGPIHTAFLKLMDQVTAEQKIFLPSCDNNAYKALFKACEKIQDLDSNVLIREQMNKQQNSNLAISGHGTPSRQHSNRHQLFYPRSTPHMKHPSTPHISTPAFTTPAVTPSKVPIEAPRVSSAVHFDGSGGIQVPSTSSIAL